MESIYTSLGLMSGTSLDGVDLSIIKSDGNKEFTPILDRFFEYDKNLINKIREIRGRISIPSDLDSFNKEIILIEKEITLFHANAVLETLKTSNVTVDLIGFHGQTIFHDTKKNVTKQLGNGNLLSQLTKKMVVFNFRENDINNGGEGAPLAPIFHNVIANKINDKFDTGFPINIINIGGITNVTLTIKDISGEKINEIYAYDIGPGNCLIDEWIRKNSKYNYDDKGEIARSGKVDKLILNQALENFSVNLDYKKSLDIKDFDIFFAKGLSLENGAATLTEFTAQMIADGINFITKEIPISNNKLLVCGGGRKNKYLLECIKNNLKQIYLEPIDKFEMNGDYIESQAFAYLAIRSLKGMPISFPNTTRCKKPSTGGSIVKNF